jgi:hypothetical protein
MFLSIGRLSRYFSGRRIRHMPRVRHNPGDLVAVPAVRRMSPRAFGSAHQRLLTIKAGPFFKPFDAAPPPRLVVPGCATVGRTSAIGRTRRNRPNQVAALASAALPSDSDAPELLAQLALGAREYAATRRREIGARAVDVEAQHRKRRAVRIRLLSAARLRRPLQRCRDPSGIRPRENPGLQIKRIASPRDFGRPQLGRLTRRSSYARSLGRSRPGGWLSHCFPDQSGTPSTLRKRRKDRARSAAQGTKPEPASPQGTPPNLLRTFCMLARFTTASRAAGPHPGLPGKPGCGPRGE